MLKTIATAATIVGCFALAGCNMTTDLASAKTAPNVGGVPSPDAANPTVNPDGTVKRLYVNR